MTAVIRRMALRAAAVALALVVVHGVIVWLVAGESRATAHALEAKHGREALDRARRVAPMPAVDAPAFQEALAANRAWDAAQVRNAAVSRAELIERGALISLLAQLGIVGWALWRATSRLRRRG